MLGLGLCWELTWLQQLLGELGITPPLALTIYCDNSLSTYLALNPVFHAQTKHIDLDAHFVRECVTSGRLQIVDIFTKGLPSSHHELMCANLSVNSFTSD